MDINTAITYVFKDERWIVKTLIGAGLLLISFLIIPIFFVNGYLLLIVRNVMDGLEEPLPEWDNWGDMFKDGLNLTIAELVYTLPIWLLMCCASAFFLPAAFSEGDVAGMLAAMGGVSFMILMCLVLLFVIVYTIISPAITIQYAREDNLSACFQFSEVIGIARDNIGDILIALLVILGLGLVLGLIGIIPFIGWIISLAGGIYVTFVSGHLFGQIGQKAGGAPKEKVFDEPAV